VFGLLGNHQALHLLILMTRGMLRMQSVILMARMDGELSYHVVPAVVVVVVIGGMVDLSLSATSVVRLGTLLVSVV